MQVWKLKCQGSREGHCIVWIFNAFFRLRGMVKILETLT